MDREYFRVIEEAFVELRGAPLLLSPEDWQIAKRWFAQGVPCDFVVAELRRVFERRKETGETGRVHRLKYVAPAIDEAWKQRQDFLATGERQTEPDAPPDRTDALERLGESLPVDLKDRMQWQRRIVGLQKHLPDAEAIERELQELETEVLKQFRDALDAGARREIERAVELSVEGVRERLSEEELLSVRRRVGRRLLRERMGLPRFTLFDL